MKMCLSSFFRRVGRCFLTIGSRSATSSAIYLMTPELEQVREPFFLSHYKMITYRHQNLAQRWRLAIISKSGGEENASTK